MGINDSLVDLLKALNTFSFLEFMFSVNCSREIPVYRSNSLKESNLNQGNRPNLNMGNPQVQIYKTTKCCIKNTNCTPLQLSPMNLGKGEKKFAGQFNLINIGSIFLLS